jgi:hypothetical protein
LKARLTGALFCFGLLLCTLATCENPSSLKISPDDVVFPVTPVGVSSAPLPVSIANPTGASVQLQEIILSGIDFVQTNDCGKELAAGATCYVQVMFKPATTGERIGNLAIAASDNGVPHFVPLSGIGE